jgi:hypothetical protein
MKRILFIICLLMQVATFSQNDPIPISIETSGNVEFSIDSIYKGENINFEFITEFNKQVSLKLYSLEGVLISTTLIEMFSGRGLALATRSFEVGTYYMCLKLKTKTLIKKVTIRA